LEKDRYCAWCKESLTNLSASEFSQHRRDHRREERGEGDEDDDGEDNGDENVDETSNDTVTKAPVGVSVEALPLDQIENHLSRSSSSQRRQDFICPFCEVRISRLCDHKTHMEMHLDELAVVEDDGRFKCKHCPKTLLNPIILHKHIRLQVGETECVVCKEPFVSYCQLVRHRNRHRKERSEAIYKKTKKRFCKICNKRFPKLSILEFAKHMKNHRQQGKSKQLTHLFINVFLFDVTFSFCE
jgi:hypothetical protein